MDWSIQNHDIHPYYVQGRVYWFSSCMYTYLSFLSACAWFTKVGSHISFSDDGTLAIVISNHLTAFWYLDKEVTELNFNGIQNKMNWALLVWSTKFIKNRKKLLEEKSATKQLQKNQQNVNNVLQLHKLCNMYEKWQ